MKLHNRRSLKSGLICTVFVLSAAIFIFVSAKPAQDSTPAYLVGSLAPAAVPLPYSDDPNDSWNLIFQALFTRDLTVRLTQEYRAGAPFESHEFMGPPANRLASKQTFLRRESGDRPIPPLYPSFLSNGGIAGLFSEPRSSEFRQALRHALAETTNRPPIERALMQADLWAAYDTLFKARGVQMMSRNSQSSEELRSAVAHLMRKVALSSTEIAALPNNYAAGAHGSLPPIFSPGSGWTEVEWRQERSHDFDADMRTSSRVFLKPRIKPADVSEFVNSFRPKSHQTPPDKELEAVALVTEQLLIDQKGVIRKSPLSIDVQIRRFMFDSQGPQSVVEQLELSRQRLREDPNSGGFVHETDAFPAYLPAAGNDYRFASPQFGQNGPDFPVLGTLHSRCISCHGTGAGRLFTFSVHAPDRLPPVKALPTAEDLHSDFVIHQKKQRPEFRALLQNW
jgi:hypothetical protein